MGSLHRFDIDRIIERFGCRIVFETGTGRGNSLERCTRSSFSKIISCEIYEPLQKSISQMLSNDPRVEVLYKSSEQALLSELPKIPASTPILFWLDAHCPGIYASSGPLDEPNEEIRLPLERELQIIRDLRPEGHDLIIVDDLRIYEQGPFERGNSDSKFQPRNGQSNGLSFLENLFSATHFIKRVYFDEGYVLLTPRIASPGAHTTINILDALGNSAEIHNFHHFSTNTAHQLGALIELFIHKIRSSSEIEILKPWIELADRSLMNANRNTRIAVSGAGVSSAMISARLISKGHRPVALCTNETEKIGNSANGIPIISHAACADLNPDKLIIGSSGSIQRLSDSFLSNFPLDPEKTEILALIDASLQSVSTSSDICS